MNENSIRDNENMVINQELIDNPTTEQQLYFDRNFVYLMLDIDFGYSDNPQEVLDGRLFPVPYWCNEGSISYGLIGNQDYDPDKCFAQYLTGYYWSGEVYGDIKTIEGKEYKFITTVRLPEEMEHQDENGKCFYEYRGNSFLAIWEEV